MHNSGPGCCGCNIVWCHLQQEDLLVRICGPEASCIEECEVMHLAQCIHFKMA